MAFKKKLTIAYEHHRYVRQEKIDAFNEKLKKQTLKRTGQSGVNLYEKYDKLVFVKLSEYEASPPVAVLDLLETAQGRECFDSYEVCKVESVIEYKDPIIFGRVNGCSDRFYVGQWDDDVKIEQILEEHEG